VLEIERDALEQYVFRKPELLQDLSQAIDERRERARSAVSGDDPSEVAAP
jgi:hypothetical protein